MAHRLHASLVAALLLGSAPASAQTTSPPLAVPDAPGQAIPPSTDPCAARPADGAQTLSGQLTECGGVLTPPDTGTPAMEAPVPAPDPGTTPVIPPGAVPDQPDGSGSVDPA